MNPNLAKSYKSKPVIKKYSNKDVIIYSLGSVAYDVGRLVFGELSMEFFEDPLTEGELRQEASIVDILDKGTGALILYEFTTYDNRRNIKLARQQFSMFQKGYGNFGGAKNSHYENRKINVPDRKPDKVIEETTSINQKMGYNGTPLHGLANFGICVKHVLDQYSNNYSTKISKAQARFSAIVYPGQTLVTEMWEERDRIVFRAIVKESGHLAVKNACIEFKSNSGKQAA